MMRTRMDKSSMNMNAGSLLLCCYIEGGISANFRADLPKSCQVRATVTTRFKYHPQSQGRLKSDQMKRPGA